MVHRLSCVMSHPPPEALVAARSVLYHAHVHRADALVFSAGNPVRAPITTDGRMPVVLTAGAPDELEVSADASTSPHAVYSVLVTCAGAAILHKTKKIGIAVGSTHDAENVATVKASEDAIYARIILRALGVPVDGTTTVITDNLSNKRVALNAHAASARDTISSDRCACTSAWPTAILPSCTRPTLRTHPTTSPSSFLWTRRPRPFATRWARRAPRWRERVRGSRPHRPMPAAEAEETSAAEAANTDGRRGRDGSAHSMRHFVCASGGVRAEQELVPGCMRLHAWVAQWCGLVRARMHALEHAQPRYRAPAQPSARTL